MAENITVNGVTYNGVDVIEAETPEGKSVGFYPDAVRYSVQRLTDEQKAQARSNIGAVNGVFVPEVDSEGNLGWSFSDASGPIITIGTNIKGPEGPEGPAGKNGWTPVPVIDSDGWLYFNLQRVERPDPEPAVNIVDMVIEALDERPEIDDPNQEIVGDNDLPFQIDETLVYESGTLRVNTTNDAEQDNTLPITSAAVYETLGNIELLLGTI